MLERILGRLDRERRRLLGALGPRGVILAYHRIGKRDPDPFRLFVSGENFAAHMEVLRRHATPMTLADMRAALVRGRVPGKAVAVTIDDGYADLVTEAIPVLERGDVPATAFVVADGGITDRGFWWDGLARIAYRADRLPLSLRYRSRGRRLEWRLEPRSARGARAEDESLSAPDAAVREAWLRSLYALLIGLARDEQREALECLARLARLDDAVPREDVPLTPEAIGRIARDGIVEVGSHSFSHARLASAPAELLLGEVGRSRERLQELTGRRIECFAYPYGTYDAAAAKAVRAAGYALACTCEGRFASAHSDPMLLPRIEVGDIEGEAFAALVESW